jgi:hypothetical protein
MVTLASKSSLRMITACGSPDQCTGLAEPLTKCEQATPSPLPMWPARPSLPLRAFQPLAASTQSRAFGQAVGHDLEAVDGVGRRLQQVAPPHFNRVEAEFGGHRVEQGLEAEADIHRAVAAHRAAGRRVGIHAVAVVLDRGYVVEAVEQARQSRGW